MKYKISEFNTDVIKYKNKLYNYFGLSPKGEFICRVPHQSVHFYLPMGSCTRFDSSHLSLWHRQHEIKDGDLTNVIFEEYTDDIETTNLEVEECTDDIETTNLEVEECTDNKLKHKVLEYSIYKDGEDFMLGDLNIRVKLMGEANDQYIQLNCFDDDASGGEISMDFNFADIYKIAEVVKKLEEQ